MINERRIRALGIIAHEFESSCNFSFDFIVVCDIVEGLLRFDHNKEGKSIVELINQLMTKVNERTKTEVHDRAEIPVGWQMVQF